MPPPAPGRPGIFSLADASYVCTALQRVGLAQIDIQPYTLGFDYRSPGEWLDFLLALNLPLREYLADLPDQQIVQIRQAMKGAVAPWVHDDGHVRFTGLGYYTTATRPLTRDEATRR